jgi:viologen exporter family transport system permease protein
VTAYWSIFSARFRTLLQYRTAAIAGVMTQLFWGLIRVMIFAGFYRVAAGPQPMTYDDVVTYVWLGQATILLTFFFRDTEVQQKIRTGTVSYDMIRPLNLYSYWFTRSVAQRTAPLLLRMIPIYVIAGLFFHLGAPASMAHGVLFVISTIGAVLLASAVGTFLATTLLWTLSGEGLNRLVPVCFYFFSGAVVPLPLYPDWAKPVVYFLPFRGVADTPFRIYMGHMGSGEITAALANQAGWTVVFVLAGVLLLSRGTKRLVVQGG